MGKRAVRVYDLDGNIMEAGKDMEMDVSIKELTKLFPVCRVDSISTWEAEGGRRSPFLCLIFSLEK